MATLMFNAQEVAVKQMFHQNGKECFVLLTIFNYDILIFVVHYYTYVGAFTLATLFIIFLTYFFIACWTYGAGIPSGLFIPCLLIGAAYGRFVATIFG